MNLSTNMQQTVQQQVSKTASSVSIIATFYGSHSFYIKAVNAVGGGIESTAFTYNYSFVPLASTKPVLEVVNETSFKIKFT